jgi:hypothetical protein
MRPTDHLDDELLSAHLDGEAPGAVDHLGACADCRARLDALDAAARLVREAPVPPPDAAVVDAAVARALDGGSRANRRPMLAALAAAAVAVLGIVGVGVLDDGGSKGDDTAASRPEALTDENSAAGAAGGEVVTDGGDLGDLNDPQALAATVRAAVEPPPEGASTAAQDSAVVAAPTGGGSGGAAATRSPTELRSTAGAKAGTKDPYCEAEVSSTYGEGLGPLAYRATLRWDGVPAVAVAYALAEPRGELDHRIYVLAVDDCRLLVAQTV